MPGNVTAGENVGANTLTVTSLSNLGDIANVIITGGNVGEAIITDGTGNLTWALATPAVIPAVYLTATADGNNQTFSNVILGGYTQASDMTVFYNGSLLPNDFYTLAGDVLTVNTLIFVDDTIDIIQATGGPVNTVISGYGNSNVAVLLSSGIVSSNIVTTANISGDYILGNGSQLTGLPAGYANANVTTLLSSGTVTSAIITTNDVTANSFVGDGSQLTGVQSPIAVIPTVYMTAVADGTGQNFSNVILSNYTANTDMTVFLNGVLLENTFYTLAGDTLTVNAHVNTGDTVDVTTQFAVGNVLNITSGYGNSNVAAFFDNFAGDIIPAVDNAYTLGNSTNQWKDLWLSGNTLYMTQVPLSMSAGNILTVDGANVVTSTPGGNVNLAGNINAGGMTINGNAIITGNANIQGNLTYNNITNLTTSNLILGLGNNQSGINVTGGGVVIGDTAEAQWLYNEPDQTWDSNLGITATGNITASYFIGNGSQLTGLPASYGNANVTNLLSSGAVSSNVTTTANVNALNLNVTTSVFSGVDIILGNIANTSATKTRITSFGANSFIQTGNGTPFSTGNIIFAPYSDANVRVRIDTSTGDIYSAGNIYDVNGQVTQSNPAFSVTGSVSTVITTTFTPTQVAYNTELLDTNGWFASNRFTPQRAGWYQINCGARIFVPSGANAECGLILRKNSNQIAGQGGYGAVSGATSQLVYFNGTTDYVDVAIYSGLTGTVSQSSGGTYFSGSYVRP